MIENKLKINFNNRLIQNCMLKLFRKLINYELSNKFNIKNMKKVGKNER